MAKKPTGTALTSWQEEMAKSAAKAVAMEQSSGGGKFFSMKAGQLAFDDVALPGNQIACVIVEGMYENVYYEGKYDPDVKAPPTCFAFGYDDEDMAPHEMVDKEPDTFQRQSDKCADCPMNEWGSADRGKGKACSNRRRLAIIPAGAYKSLGKGKGFDLELFDEPDAFKTDLAYMKLPVTSVKAYSKYVREVAEQLNKPLWAVFTNVYLEPDPKTQFKVCFELLEEVPDELMEMVFKRHQEAEKEIDFPYVPRSDDDEEEAQPVTRNSSAAKLGKKPAAKAPAKKAPPKRR